MARRPRRDQFASELNPTLHCVSQCVRRAFLLGHDPVTGIDHSHRRAWAVRRLRELAKVFAIDVDTFAFLENHMHLLLTLRWDLAAEWAAEAVVDRWLRITGAREDPIARDEKRRAFLHDHSRGQVIQTCPALGLPRVARPAVRMGSGVQVTSVAVVSDSLRRSVPITGRGRGLRPHPLTEVDRGNRCAKLLSELAAR